MKGVMAGGEHALLEIIAASHAGNTTVEFEQVVKDWVTTAKHPKTGRLYTEMVYQPMLEVLDYLRANGFKTYIVSGGGVEFMRPWVERVYGIPPEQVVGSRIKMKYEVRNGVPVIVRLAEIDFVDDKAGKPVGIQQVIGRRPTIAFGNSDGDFEMLEWTTTAPGPRLGVIVHHTDAEREWAYDRESSIGRLVRGLDEAAARGWVVVDMKQEWARIFRRVREMGSKRPRQKIRQSSGKGGHANRTSRMLVPLAVAVIGGVGGGSTPLARRRPRACRAWPLFSRPSRTRDRLPASRRQAWSGSLEASSPWAPPNRPT